MYTLQILSRLLVASIMATTARAAADTSDQPTNGNCPGVSMPVIMPIQYTWRINRADTDNDSITTNIAAL